MSSKTKIVVLRMKEIIYTAIFIGLAILLVGLFLIMFRPKKEAPSASQTRRLHRLSHSGKPEYQCGSGRRRRQD